MAHLCEQCGAIFTGEHSEKRYNEHMHEHYYNDTPAISDKKIIREYEVLPRDYDDYACCKLRDIETGKIILDGKVYDAVRHTNINLLEKLIGKKIRITTYAEIIE